MNDFYRVSIEERTERLIRLAIEALKHWDVTDCEPVLIKFRENAVFRVSGPDGKPAALRIHRHAYHTDDELRSELAWMQALRAEGIEVPVVVPTRKGLPFTTISGDGIPEPRQVDMQAWLDGEPFGSIEQGLSPAVTNVRKAFELVGRLAARLHDHAAKWPRPPGFTRSAWNLEGLLGERPVWGRFWELEALTPDERSLIDRARARAGADLAAYGQSAGTYGLIHADFLSDNLLLDGEEVKLLDFDDAGDGWHLFDLATASFWFRGSAIYETIGEAIIHGYRSVRALPDRELRHMRLFNLVRGFTYLGWVHTRYETPTARELAPGIIELACGLAEEYLASQDH